MYSLIGISMVLTAAMLASLTTSLLLTASWGMLTRLATRLSATAESRFWLVAGCLPVAIGACAGLLVVAPGYLKYEPRHTEEHIGPMLGTLAAISLALLLTSVCRTALVALKGSKLASELKIHARRVQFAGVEQEVFELPESSRISTVVGVLRPTMFFSRAVLSALEEAELNSVLRHERAHVSARDNATVLMLDLAGRLAGNPVFARAVKSQWMEAAEIAADRVAVRNANEALEMMSALVKVARLETCPTVIGLGCSFIPSAKKSHLRRRIENLQAIADGKGIPSGDVSPALKSGLIAIAVTLLVCAPALMGAAHAGLELLMK